MKTLDVINTITQNMGDFGTYLLGNEMYTFGDLPTLPSDYTLYKVKNEKDINLVKNIMKIMNSEIDTLYPNSEYEINMEMNDYECRCFSTSLLFTNIYDYWCGINKSSKYIHDDMTISAYFDSLHSDVWRWIKDEISTDELKESAFEFKDKVRGN